MNRRAARYRTQRFAAHGHVDVILIVFVFALACFGILAIAGATYDPEDGENLSLLSHIINSTSASMQSIFLLLCPFALAIVVAFPYEVIRARTPLFYIAILSLLVLVIGLSQVNRGIKAFFTLGGGRMFQPAEFAKPAMILMLARTMARKEVPMSTVRDWFITVGIFAVPAMVILVQGEAGTIIVMAVIFAGMIYFGGVRLRVFFGTIVPPLLLLVGVFAFLVANGSDNFRVERILAFLDPEAYSQSGGYQLLNSQTAIGMGGMTGRGFFVTGTITELGYVPDNWTDFIFSSVGESTGFIGSVCVIAAYVFIVLRMLYLSSTTADKFGRLVISGVATMLFFNAFENTAMSVGLMPITGIPLPFLSYGGSSLASNMLCIGLVLNVVRNRADAALTGPALPQR